MYFPAYNSPRPEMLNMATPSPVKYDTRKTYKTPVSTFKNRRRGKVGSTPRNRDHIDPLNGGDVRYLKAMSKA